MIKNTPNWQCWNIRSTDIYSICRYCWR